MTAAAAAVMVRSSSRQPAKRRVSPEQASAWGNALGDVIAPLVGAFAAVYGILEIRDIAILTGVLTFAGALIGVPYFRRTGGNDSK